jgi:hypothetical protein
MDVMDPAPRKYRSSNIARFENFVGIEGVVIVHGLLLVQGSIRRQLCLLAVQCCHVLRVRESDLAGT